MDNVLPCSLRPVAVRPVDEKLNVMVDAADATQVQSETWIYLHFSYGHVAFLKHLHINWTLPISFTLHAHSIGHIYVFALLILRIIRLI